MHILYYNVLWIQLEVLIPILVPMISIGSFEGIA